MNRQLVLIRKKAMFSFFKKVVVNVEKISGNNIHMGIGDIHDNEINDRANHTRIHDAEREKLKNMLESINEMKNKILTKVTHSEMVESWKAVSSKLESMDFSSESIQQKNETYEEVRALTLEFLRSGKVELARLCLHCEFSLIKKFYFGRSRLKKLVQLAMSMQQIAKKMVQLNYGDQFLEEQEFMEDIIEVMQKTPKEGIDMPAKTKLISGFCIAYGGCCIETNHNDLAKEITQKIIFLMETMYYESVSMNAVLASCYQNLGVAFYRLGDEKSANKAFAKKDDYQAKLNERIKKKRELGMPPIFDSADQLVLSVTKF